MRIVVTQNDIDAALRRRSLYNKTRNHDDYYSPYAHCPVAQSLTRRGLDFRSVGNYRINLRGGDEIKIPKELRDWIVMFDRRHSVKPIIVNVEIE